MLGRGDFKNESQKVIDWIATYFDQLKHLPVKSQVAPGDIYSKIPDAIPEDGHTIDKILKDTTDIILPGITHWQHPNFHAYFPANSSVESQLAEMITTALAAQCMIWDTSPAAAELEQKMMEWMRDAMGLPRSWEGVIQDTASTATLVAIICAREKVTNFESNENGVLPNLRVYCSSQTHSSIEKGAVIAGIGRKNVIKVGSPSELSLPSDKLENQIIQDIEKGKKPCCVIVALGTTGTVEVDDLKAISQVCTKYSIWLHIDAAYAGSALFLPEYRWMMEGGEEADSFVFNPHKWLFTNFDCTAYYVKDVDHLLRTFEILPEYLKSKSRGLVNDYRDWGIPLGRRFRALKLWYVLRSYGLSGIRNKLRNHIELTEYFVRELEKNEFIQILKAPFLNFTCFRLNPKNSYFDNNSLNELNEVFINNINKTGIAYLTHTKIDQQYGIRVVLGQTYLEKTDVDRLIKLIQVQAKKMMS